MQSETEWKPGREPVQLTGDSLRLRRSHPCRPSQNFVPHSPRRHQAWPRQVLTALPVIDMSASATHLDHSLFSSLTHPHFPGHVACVVELPSLAGMTLLTSLSLNLQLPVLPAGA